MLAVTLLIWRWGANTERQRAALVLGAPIPRPAPRASPLASAGSTAGPRACATAATWRGLGYLLLLGPVGIVSGRS